MEYITKFAEGFMSLFQTGAETFISWMTGIVPANADGRHEYVDCFLRRRTRDQSGTFIFKKSFHSLFAFTFPICLYVRKPNVVYYGSLFT